MTENKVPEQPQGPGPGQEYSDRFNIGDTPEDIQRHQAEFRSEVPKGPSEEELKRFRTGEEEARQFPQPEWKSELPEIKGQLGAGDDERPDLREEFERRYGFGYVSPSGMVEGYAGEIKRLRRAETTLTDAKAAEPKTDNAKKNKEEAIRALEKEIPERKERLVDRYEEIGHAIENQIQEAVEYWQDIQGNLYPYEHRSGEFFFRDLSNSIDKALRDREISDGDKGIIRRLKQEALYAEGLWTNMVALGVIAVPYYDAVEEMGTLIMPHRKLPEKSFERAFQRQIRGVDLTPAQKDVMGRIVEGVKNPEKQTLLEGLRETATKYHSHNFLWRAGVASAHQWDYENPPPRPDAEVRTNERMQMYLHPRELKFIQLLFGQGEVITGVDVQGNAITEFRQALDLRGDGDGFYDEKDWVEYKGRRVPQALLNWYSMGESEENMEAYQAIMETLLLRDTRAAIDTIIEKTQDESEADRQLRELALKIKKEALERVRNWEAGGERGLKGRLCEIAVWNGIIQDLGFMSAGEFAWGWNYELTQVTDKNRRKLKKDTPRITRRIANKDIEFAVKRKKGSGGIYVTFDIPAAMFWAHNIINYHENAETTSVLMLPSDGAYRLMFDELPPYKVPYKAAEMVFAPGKPFDEGVFDREVNGISIFQNDPFLKRAYDKLFSQEEEWRTWRRNPVRRGESFGEMDPEVRKYLKENLWFWRTPYYSRKPENKLYFPVFFPPNVMFMNFWRDFNVTTKTEVGNIRKGPSVFDQMLARQDLRDIPYLRMRRHMVDRYRVDLDMFRRILRLYVNPHVFDRAGQDEFKKFILEGGTTALKEQDKRARLGWERDQAIKIGAGKLAINPQTVILGTIRRHSLFSEKTIESPELRKLWREDVRDIIIACFDLPSRHGDIENFNGSMAQLVNFYAIIAYRMAMAEYYRKKEWTFDVDKAIEADWADTFDKLGEPLEKAQGMKI